MRPSGAASGTAAKKLPESSEPAERGGWGRGTDRASECVSVCVCVCVQQAAAISPVTIANAGIESRRASQLAGRKESPATKEDRRVRAGRLLRLEQ